MAIRTFSLRIRLSFLVLLLFSWNGRLSVSSFPVCTTPKLKDFVIAEDNQCPINQSFDLGESFFGRRGLIQVNGTDLERLLLILNSKESVHAAVLVYARWCPFSRALLPLYDGLAKQFPSIYHFAVESSSLQKGAFSYYGVNSFPVLFFHNKTSKLRYQGKRTYDAITKFYEECSGLKPITLLQYKRDNKDMPIETWESQLSINLQEETNSQCDFYLILSLIFLISRGLFYVLPKVHAAIRQYWQHKQASWQAYWSLLHRIVLSKFQPKQSLQLIGRSFEGKNPKIMDFTQESGKALLSMPGWSSSSLTPVSLAEASGGKPGIKGVGDA
ncbi:hypothetical protein KP509_02G010600 [Ceratopteris richardii]|uniref:Thioredoxin domain-containing protein n=1 Tax=Ceratopteris richardii TaxID=49495 RepID=A0A8T2V7D2_CERRI|nr:hypothetical protein KP509_02G010600 [Ceratopteris richardii]